MRKRCAGQEKTEQTEQMIDAEACGPGELAEEAIKMVELKADGTGLLQTIFILDGPFLF